MSDHFAAIRERSIQNLFAFLTTELSLGMVFAGIAKHYREAGKVEQYETSKRHALAAIEAVNHFKERLPESLRIQIEEQCSELAGAISAL